MEPELSIDEACRYQLLEPSDYARQCNPDGSAKRESSITLYDKNNPSHSVTVTHSTLYAVGIGFVLLVTAVLVCVILLAKRRRRSQKSRR